jgi:hypothetical protein
MVLLNLRLLGGTEYALPARLCTVIRSIAYGSPVRLTIARSNFTSALRSPRKTSGVAVWAMVTAKSSVEAHSLIGAQAHSRGSRRIHYEPLRL